MIIYSNNKTLAFYKTSWLTLSPGVMTRVALAFSLRRNVRSLLRTEVAHDDISCLHGLRAIFSLIIYLIHRGVFGLFIPFVNRTELAEVKHSSS